MDYNPAAPQSGVFGQLVVTDEARVQLLEMAKWTRFLAIVNFILIGLMVLFGVLFGVVTQAMGGDQIGPLATIGGIGIILIYLLIAAVVFYPFYAMLRYANGVRAALRDNNEGQFTTALRDLKRVFKYTGILTLISLGLYVLLIVGMVATAALR